MNAKVIAGSHLDLLAALLYLGVSLIVSGADEQQVLNALRSNVPSVRLSATQDLLAVKSRVTDRQPEYLEALSSLLADPNAGIRHNALYLIYRLALQHGADLSFFANFHSEKLLPLLDEKAKDVPRSALAILKIIDTLPRGAIPKLKELASSSDPQIRGLALIFLTMLEKGNPEIDKKLLEDLSSEKSYVITALRTIAESGTSSADIRAKIVSLIESRDEGLRIEALEALAGIYSHNVLETSKPNACKEFN